MTTDTSERGLERLICTALAGHPCEPPAASTVAEPAADYGGVGWSGGNFHDYDREYCVDLIQLSAFLHATQPNASESLRLSEDDPKRREFLTRLQGEICQARQLSTYCVTASSTCRMTWTCSTARLQPETRRLKERFEQNRFTVTRQLHYSRDETQRALDIGLFINGLPVFTFELKNSLTKQTVDDAVWQYVKDRNPREKLFAARSLRGPLRRGREPGALLHPPPGQVLVVPALQPGLERRRGQPAQPERAQDRLPVAHSADPREPDQHPGELRPGGGV